MNADYFSIYLYNFYFLQNIDNNNDFKILLLENY